jgi:uncharacterized protein YuzE
MKRPTRVELDLEVDVGYVYYEHEEFDHSERVVDGVNVDYGASGDVLGIELLVISAGSIASATEFAHSRGLAFPTHLGEAFIAA